MTDISAKKLHGNSVRNTLILLISLALPTMAEQVLSTLLQYVDTAMVGNLGEKATAAVNLTTTVSWLTGSISSSFGIAFLAMLSRAYGAKDSERMQKISQQTLLFVIVTGSVLGAVCMALSPFIPKWMGGEKDIIKDASQYFFIISIPMIFRVASSILGSAIRAVQDTRRPMLITLGSNILNILLNYVFIYMLDTGVKGAAISSAVSYTAGGILMFLLYRRNQNLRWEYKTFRADKGIISVCLKTSMPILCTNITSCLGYIVFAAQVTRLGTTVFAAHSIAVTAETLFYIPGYGLRTATSALVGASIGEKNGKKFSDVKNLSILITVIMMMISGLILYFTSVPLMSIFTDEKEVINIGSEMLRLVAFSEPFFGIMIVMEGIFYGLGKTKYPFFTETLSMWGVRILFTFLCVHVWNLGLREVWYCMIADNIFKALLFTLPMISRKFRKNISGFI